MKKFFLYNCRFFYKKVKKNNNNNNNNYGYTCSDCIF